MVRIKSKNVHFEDGNIDNGVIELHPKKPITVLSYKSNVDVDVGENHVAPAIWDNHVHFRESYMPTSKEFVENGGDGREYDFLRGKEILERSFYNIDMGMKAALKGGVCGVGLMGNTIFAPVGEHMWKKSVEYAKKRVMIGNKKGLIVHVWPRAAPGVEMIEGQSEKDFGSTFGGSGLSYEQRLKMYGAHAGGDIRFHTDRARENFSLKEFMLKFGSEVGKGFLHDVYFNPETVLIELRQSFEIAKMAGLKCLTPLHMSTGSGLNYVISERMNTGNNMRVPIGIGLDYLGTCIDDKIDDEARWINYRRPAHTTRYEQLSMIELMGVLIRGGDMDLFIESDHAPHPLERKIWMEGLPGSPGTRVIEHYTQILQGLVNVHGFSYQEVDKLASINPANHMLSYIRAHTDLSLPIGGIKDGNMANIRVFDPSFEYRVDEKRLAKEFGDSQYHSGYKNRKDLRGRNLFTAVDGLLFDTRDKIKVWR